VGQAWDQRPPTGPCHDPSVRFALASVVVMALASAFAWQAPGRNAWPAAALVAALGLDAASRLAAAAVSDKRGIEVALRGMPSPVLALARAAGFGGMALGVALCLRPDAFPVLASGFAGIVAMAASARLALARVVLGLDPEPTELNQELGRPPRD